MTPTVEPTTTEVVDDDDDDDDDEDDEVEEVEDVELVRGKLSLSMAIPIVSNF